VGALGEKSPRAEVLKAFGLAEDDLPAIRAEGERLLREDAEPDELGDPCGEASEKS